MSSASPSLSGIKLTSSLRECLIRENFKRSKAHGISSVTRSVDFLKFLVINKKPIRNEKRPGMMANTYKGGVSYADEWQSPLPSESWFETLIRWIFKNGPFPASFFIFVTSNFNTVDRNVQYKFCR